MSKKKKVTIIIPCYNEGAGIPLLYTQLKLLMDQNPGYDWEVLVIDDGSSDQTLPEIKSLRERDRRVGYVSFSRNFGKENAMLAGFDYARGDCAVIMDADLQHPPRAIPEMLKKWEEGYDEVYGKRLSRGREPEGNHGEHS